MKRRLLPLALIIPALAILSYLAGDKLILVARIAQLYAAEPDQQLAMPVAGVSKDKVNDSWHAPRNGGERQHEGQDIFAPRGTPVLSATDGYVVSVAENKLGGRTVSVVGAGGRVYYYAHLDQYADDIGVGNRVTPETVLGYVGTTGNAVGTSPHLHFGVYSSKGAINPLPLLTDRVEGALAPRTAPRAGKKRR
jgi:murein DD-endopeptidase MepM/ murein hydrolase activator NlpD